MRVTVLHRVVGEEACCLDLLYLFLPHLKNVHVQAVTEVAGGLLVTARTRVEEAVCRSCGTSSVRVHSRYRRRLRDLATAGRAVVVELEARRFFCG